MFARSIVASWFATPWTPPLWQRDFSLVNCFVLRRFLTSERSGVVKTICYVPQAYPMAWPKKNTNHISIDDVTYLWRVKPYTLELALTVQRESTPGRYLVVIFPEGHQITPKLVRNFVVDALALGWLTNDSTIQYFWMRGVDRLRDAADRDWRN